MPSSMDLMQYICLWEISTKKILEGGLWRGIWRGRMWLLVGWGRRRIMRQMGMVMVMVMGIRRWWREEEFLWRIFWGKKFDGESWSRWRRRVWRGIWGGIYIGGLQRWVFFFFSSFLAINQSTLKDMACLLISVEKKSSSTIHPSLSKTFPIYPLLSAWLKSRRLLTRMNCPRERILKNWLGLRRGGKEVVEIVFLKREREREREGNIMWFVFLFFLLMRIMGWIGLDVEAT